VWLWDVFPDPRLELSMVKAVPLSGGAMLLIGLPQR
jgi:hypothetical protein